MRQSLLALAFLILLLSYSAHVIDYYYTPAETVITFILIRLTIGLLKNKFKNL